MFRTVSSIVAVVLLSGGVAYGQAEFQWVPVDSSGLHVIDGNQIRVSQGGHTVTLEFALSGWSPEHLAAYQVTVDSGGYENGVGDPLTPLGWPGSPYDGATVDWFHPQYVFEGMVSIPAVALMTLDYQWGAAILVPPGKSDDGQTYYGGTLILDVPPGASGTYTIDFVGDPSLTFMREYDNTPIVPVTLAPALITIDPSVAIPAVSEWGVAVLALLVLTVGKVAFMRRRATG